MTSSPTSRRASPPQRADNSQVQPSAMSVAALSFIMGSPESIRRRIIRISRRTGPAVRGSACGRCEGPSKAPPIAAAPPARHSPDPVRRSPHPAGRQRAVRPSPAPAPRAAVLRRTASPFSPASAPDRDTGPADTPDSASGSHPDRYPAGSGGRRRCCPPALRRRDRALERRGKYFHNMRRMGSF